MGKYKSIIVYSLILIVLILFSTIGYKYLSKENSPQELQLNNVANISTNEISELEDKFAHFINEMIPQNANDILALKLYKKWLRKNTKPSYKNCVGYKVPLFLGGKDKISNYEESDMEVYWSISAQIISKIKNLPDGTVIDSFSIL